jgi:DNA-binding NtrC family response regulator
MLQKSHCPRVLVVDDEPLIRWSLTETLTDRGYDVVEAGSGEAAVDAVSDARNPFEVVLLDLRLPDSHDLSILSRIRRLAPTTQVILMTAFGTDDVLSGALELGAYRVVHKPFEVGELASLVSEARGSGFA